MHECLGGVSTTVLAFMMVAHCFSYVRQLGVLLVLRFAAKTLETMTNSLGMN